MIERVHDTPRGAIHYWVDALPGNGPALTLLPGLTADHRLFEKQVEHFRGKVSLMVWDPPGHAASWPFQLDFTLMDMACWLDDILTAEGFRRPVIVGQSMGGYVGQAYAQRFPGKLAGFVSVDSAPLQRRYVTGVEIALLKRMEPVYRYYPWKWLLRSGTNGVSTTGRAVRPRHADAGRGHGGRSALCNRLPGAADLRHTGSGRILQAIQQGLAQEHRHPAALDRGRGPQRQHRPTGGGQPADRGFA